MSYAQNYFGESHEILRQNIRRLVLEELKPHVEEWEEQGAFPRELYQQFGEMGFLGIGFPEDCGGGGGDLFHGIAFTEELMRCGSMGVAVGLGTHTIALPPVVAMGTEEQKQRFVRPVLEGEKIAALAITEPDAGSDVASIRTRAERRGDRYIVNGSKTFISSGCRADQLTVAVRTGGKGFGGISILVVDTSTPGFHVDRNLKKMGWWASDTASLSFDDVEVPVENRIGEENQGFAVLMSNFAGERLSLSVMAHAAAQIALEETLRYVRERQAFGRPLAGFQVLRHRLAEMATRVEVAREFNYRVAARVEDGSATPAELAMAKNFACQACQQVVHDAVQLHGGYGYSRDFLVERLYRDVRILSIGGGTHEIMNEIITKSLDLG